MPRVVAQGALVVLTMLALCVSTDRGKEVVGRVRTGEQRLVVDTAS